MTIEFDYREWQSSSHKNGPRGYGSWCFSVGRDVQWQLDHEIRTGNLVIGPTYLWVNQATFSEAKRAARKIAQEHGWSKLYVQP